MTMLKTSPLGVCGGGGRGETITVVQEEGQSTTDVMSQKAVSDMGWFLQQATAAPTDAGYQRKGEAWVKDPVQSISDVTNGTGTATQGIAASSKSVSDAVASITIPLANRGVYPIIHSVGAADLNTITQHGFHYHNSSATNKPADQAGYMLVLSEGTNLITQINFRSTTGTNYDAAYRRNSTDNGATWTPWLQMTGLTRERGLAPNCVLWGVKDLNSMTQQGFYKHNSNVPNASSVQHGYVIVLTDGLLNITQIAFRATTVSGAHCVDRRVSNDNGETWSSWVRIAGDGVTARASGYVTKAGVLSRDYGITSCTKKSTGVYELAHTLTTTIVHITPAGVAGGTDPITIPQASTAASLTTVRFVNTADALVDSDFFFSIF